MCGCLVIKEVKVKVKVEGILNRFYMWFVLCYLISGSLSGSVSVLFTS